MYTRDSRISRNFWDILILFWKSGINRSKLIPQPPVEISCC